jgi:glycosyltransferase involved in cell wall biosynthesis
MRIAVLYTPLVTHGGAERQALEEVAALKRRGHDVTLLTFRLDERVLAGSPIRRDDVCVLHASGWLAQVRALRGVLAHRRPDVLVSHTSPELTWLATRRTGVRYVQYHNSPPFYIGADANPYMASNRYRRVFPQVSASVAGYEDLSVAAPRDLTRRALTEGRAWLKHRALRDAAAVIVPSHRTARELRLLHGVGATVVRGCLPQSLLDDPRGAIADRDAIVLSVCRLERVKRIDLLLHAFAAARESMPDARLVIAGAGADEPRLRAIAASLALGESVEFAGYVSDADLWPLIASARVFAAPAMADFNIAPYEAMALGCNVVWTDEMETDDAIAASGQVFVAPPETTAFAAAIVAALATPAGRRAHLSSMTWDARAARIESILRNAAPAAAPVAATLVALPATSGTVAPENQRDADERLAA